jgi:hypothetical protein
VAVARYVVNPAKHFYVPKITTHNLGTPTETKLNICETGECGRAKPPQSQSEAVSPPPPEVWQEQPTEFGRAEHQPTTPLLEHASRTGNNVDGEQSGRDEMNGPEMTKNSLLNDKSGARERNNMDLCLSIELSQAQNIGELRQAQNIGELSQAQNIEIERLDDPYVRAWLKW